MTEQLSIIDIFVFYLIIAVPCTIIFLISLDVK